VATAFALGVLEPNASGIGGGGFMVVRLANMNEAVVIDFRPTAPAAATPDMYALDERGRPIGNASVEGGLAVRGAGEVKGLLYALEHYGSKKLTRAQVLQPAIDRAERGVPVTAHLAQIIKDNFGKLRKVRERPRDLLERRVPARGRRHDRQQEPREYAPSDPGAGRRRDSTRATSPPGWWPK